MAAPADYENPDEWELVNDDGFVHKRKKRPRLDPSATSSAASQPPDPAVERKHRRERKKKALLKLKDKYLQEISRWELLANALKEMEQNATAQSVRRQEMHSTTSFAEASGSEEHLASDSTRRRVVDDLLSQVEAQEAIIRDVSNLCDVAESLCSAQEERLKQQLTDLPIWEPSPLELMAALGEQ
ncbi:hypothetical protein CDL12_24829 [Handroanthus impetiginosus]|uniref:Uncharacterized protein n=1 Tax=Handroanthus impetiginosus TaxID=429701 RepID=A0A2G9GBQ8_9LAMI|nr:hypothetical protein CDL12_24829 [Handroanthus impetiginosus]